MCGIVGYWGLDGSGIGPGIFEQMLASLHHRGPDDTGSWQATDVRLRFGHKRLSILDLSSKGHQPMSNDAGDIWITYNGEVYNFKEIRTELASLGHRFRSDSDTEVIIKAYQEWGIRSIDRFCGMFAFALWDARKRKLFLVRDRAGVKPLYYHHDGKMVIFGSELKALLHCPAIDRELDFTALFHYFQFGYISAPHSVLKSVSIVRPGHYVEISADGKIEHVKYWDIADFYRRGIELEESGFWKKKNEKDVTAELEEILARGFGYRMVSDVPVGIFLSSGIDSSILAAILAKRLGLEVNTFTIGFTKKEFNEAEDAKKIARALGTHHRELYIDPDTALNTVNRLPEIFDEPFGDNSGIPTYLVSKMAREHVKVALSADGGDELFAGYHRYNYAIRYQRFLERSPTFVSHLSRRFLDMAPLNLLSATYTALSSNTRLSGLEDKMLKAKRMLSQSDPAALYEAAMSDWYGQDLSDLMRNRPASRDRGIRATFDGLADADFMTRMMCLDFKKYMVDDVLTKVDRASMAVSLEAREPFLDHNLLEYIATLPSTYKYRDGQAKYILRKILYQYLPQSMFQRPKQGFAAPIGEWLRGPLKVLVDGYLDPERIREGGIFDALAVSRTLDRFRRRKGVSANQIWHLLQFQMWHEQWSSPRTSSAAPPQLVAAE